MPDLFQEPPCSQPGPPELPTVAELAEAVTDLSRRLSAVETRAGRKRPAATGRLRTRPDRCRFGFQPFSKNSTRLRVDVGEQKVIQFIIEAARGPVMGPRAICRLLDEYGHRRRGKKWYPGGHNLVRAILQRNPAETSAAATAAVQQRIADQQAGRESGPWQ